MNEWKGKSNVVQRIVIVQKIDENIEIWHSFLKTF